MRRSSLAEGSQAIPYAAKLPTPPKKHTPSRPYVWG
jgi:hypothetical protein